MKYRALFLALALAGIANPAVAQDELIRFDSFGACIAARHQALNDYWRGNRPEGFQGNERFVPKIECRLYPDGYWYLSLIVR
jgi:hypothetical protein